MAPKVFKERGPNPLSVMAIFHPFLKIKRKKSPLHNFTVLIPTHLQTSLTLKSEATGQESSARPTYPHRTGSEREPVLTVTFYQSVQFSHQSSLTLCTPKDCSTPRFPVHHQLQELTQTHVHHQSVMPSNHLILCRPFLLPPSIFPSIRVFSN